ncbi:hypothetical protein SAMN04488134_10824 [Amphibacillus marinus]|uniref:Uncharacterized protein n=1 Tax=Amphibacillus marinus TaxID=872970 RepID=A0A1H8Q2Y1_9BACI|nr:hypothetical protein [Amphibacillus marinus]SEO48579.1 hypothetical protein SAMN04488134_10824 [Amphibacillus marinus]
MERTDKHCSCRCANNNHDDREVAKPLSRDYEQEFANELTAIEDRQHICRKSKPAKK